MTFNDDCVKKSDEKKFQEFELIELGKVSKISMGQSPPSKYYNYEGDGIPFLQGVKTFGNKYPKYDTRVTRPLKIATKGEVLFSVRAPVGEVNIATTDVCIGRGLASISGYDNEFIYYLLKSFGQKVIDRQTGTVFGAVGREILESTKLPIPSQTEQKAIAKILSDLDSKIELNQKMNKTLESIAHAIFKHWFIYFEFPNEEGKPYKSGGGEMVDSELGKIPKGWKVDKLSKIANVIDCLHSKKPNFVKSQNFILQLYNFNEIHSIDLSDPYTVSDGDFHMWTRNITVKYGDILVSNAAKVGAISQVPEWFVGGIGRNITTIRAQGIGEYFLLYYLTSPLGTNQISMNTDVGTLFNSLNVKGIRLLRVLIPNSDLMKRSNFIFNSLRRKIETNLLENTFLKSTRDLLLPKLMAGKIRISAKVKENE